MIDKQLVNLSEVAAAASNNAMPALYITVKKHYFLIHLIFFLHKPNLGCLRKMPKF